MMQRIRYARNSVDDQNLDLQLDAINKAGISDGRLYEDTASGKDFEHMELAARLKVLREGDDMVVRWSDRLG